MTEQSADRPILNDEGQAVHHPFGGYTIETESLPDGRRIHYYAWPDTRADDSTADPPPAEPRS